MKYISLVALYLALTQTCLAAETPRVPTKIDRPGAALSSHNNATVQVKPENRIKLCSPNVTLSCKTNTVTKGSEICKQDECTCVNPDGKDTYSAVDTALYDCIPANPGVKAPAKVQGY